MRIYRGKIPNIAREIVDVLSRDGSIEVARDDEARPLSAAVQGDIEAVLHEYLRLDQEISESAKDRLEQRKLDHSHFAKVRRAVAKEKGFGLGDDALDYVLNQINETLFYSKNVDEVFAEDHELRKKMADIFRKHLEVDEELDKEVRRRIRNLVEGTEAWDIEYERVLKQLKRTRGLE